MAEKALVTITLAILVATVAFASQQIGWLAEYANAWDNQTYNLDFAVHAQFDPVDPAWAADCRERYQAFSAAPEVKVPLANAAAESH
jgi:hypothetical protein